MATERYKILIVPGILPFPPNDGGRTCIYAFIEALRFMHEIHLYLPVSNKETLALVEEYRAKLPEIIFHTPDFTGKIQKRSAIRKLLSFGKRTLTRSISIFKTLSQKKNNQTDQLGFWNNYKNSPLFLPFPENYTAGLMELFRRFKFDIVQTEYTNTLNLVTLIPAGPKKIFVNLESRHSILKDSGKLANINEDYIHYVSENMKLQEYAFLKKYDSLFTLNPSDFEESRKDLPGVKVFNSPFPVLDSQVSEENSEPFLPAKLIFLGGENHSPNLDAMNWFVDAILPSLQTAAGMKLYITGAWRKSTIRRFQKINPSIVFTGLVENVNAVMQNSISIVPIRLGGGGLRSKIIHSMAAGIPVVTTSIASVGLEAVHEREYLVANSAEEFSAAIEKLFTDHALAKKIVDNGKLFVKNNFSQKVLAEKRNSFYHSIMN